MPSIPTALLHVDALEKRFGGIKALMGYCIDIMPDDLVGLIGPNGAGKTTVFNLLSGVLTPTSGYIQFDGRDISRFRPDQNARLGVARTFQNIRLFNDLSVKNNIKIAFHMRMGKGLVATLLSLSSFRQSEKQMNRQADEFLELLNLIEVKNELAGNLPYGVQRRVEIARALAAQPRLLLLDEPAAGMNPNETDSLIDVIRRIHDQYRLAIFLVEHEMRLVMNLCHRIQVLDGGQMLAMGTPEEIRNNPQVIEAYLGKQNRGSDAQR